MCPLYKTGDRVKDSLNQQHDGPFVVAGLSNSVVFGYIEMKDDNKTRVYYYDLVPQGPDKKGTTIALYRAVEEWRLSSATE